MLQRASRRWTTATLESLTPAELPLSTGRRRRARRAPRRPTAVAAAGRAHQGASLPRAPRGTRSTALGQPPTQGPHTVYPRTFPGPSCKRRCHAPGGNVSEHRSGGRKRRNHVIVPSSMGSTLRARVVPSTPDRCRPGRVDGLHGARPPRKHAPWACLGLSSIRVRRCHRC